MPRFSLVGLLFVLLVASGCPSPKCPTLPHTSPLHALDSLRSMRRPVRTMRAEARVDQRGGKGRIRGTVFMFIERPDRVRFDAMTQFGPAAILTSDGSRFALADLREKRHLVGPACPTNIARLLGIRLSGAEVARLLLGDTPRIEASDQSITCTGDGTYRIELRAVDGARQEIELSIRDGDREKPAAAQHLRLARSELFDAEGASVWRVAYSDYRFLEDPASETVPPQGVVMPFEIHFRHARDDAEVRVRFKTIDLNRSPPPGAFQQEPRPGLTPEEVACE